MSRRVTRKEFLKMTAVAGTAAVASGSLISTPSLAAGGLTTIAEDQIFAHVGAPQLFGATGIAGPTRRLAAEGITHLNVLAQPQSGPFVEAWMFGGHVGQAIFRKASIELQLDGLTGYHFVELGIRQLYPYDSHSTNAPGPWPSRKAPLNHGYGRYAGSCGRN